MNDKQRTHTQNVIDRIWAERNRQITVENWTPEHDDEHADGELAQAAVCYALGETTVSHHHADLSINVLAEINLNPFEDGFREAVKKKSRTRQLEIAGAFIVAEIERLERLAALSPAEGEGEQK